MPFDPTYPPTNALIESAPLRAQFNGLKDLIDAIPAGPPGPEGPPGEVTQADLNNAVLNLLSQSSSNSNAVPTVGQVADASYNPAQLQDLINKIDELILALRR